MGFTIFILYVQSFYLKFWICVLAFQSIAFWIMLLVSTECRFWFVSSLRHSTFIDANWISFSIPFRKSSNIFCQFSNTKLQRPNWWDSSSISFSLFGGQMIEKCLLWLLVVAAKVLNFFFRMSVFFLWSSLSFVFWCDSAFLETRPVQKLNID